MKNVERRGRPNIVGGPNYTSSFHVIGEINDTQESEPVVEPNLLGASASSTRRRPYPQHRGDLSRHVEDVMNLRVLPILPAVAAIAWLTAAAEDAAATTLVALTEAKTLIRVNLELGTVTGQVNVGNGGVELVGIDVRPADGKLYGLFKNRNVVTIDPTNGATTFKSRLSTALPTVRLSVDFNPVADRLRIVSKDGTNLRANVDDGTVTTDTSLTLPNPNIGGIAYTNSVPGATSTLLFDIGSTPKTLFIQSPPNDGVLIPVGQLGGAGLRVLGFDIVIGQDGRNRGWFISRNKLMEIDLAGGRIISQRTVVGLDAEVRDIAILPN